MLSNQPTDKCLKDSSVEALTMTALNEDYRNHSYTGPPSWWTTCAVYLKLTWTCLIWQALFSDLDLCSRSLWILGSDLRLSSSLFFCVHFCGQIEFKHCQNGVNASFCAANYFLVDTFLLCSTNLGFFFSVCVLHCNYLQSHAFLFLF